MNLNIAQTKDMIRSCMTANVPLFIHGVPGGGKSMAMEQAAKEEGYRYIDIRLSQKDAVDLCGIPFRDLETNRTMWAVPTMWPSDPNEKVLIGFDEMNHGTQQTLSAAFQIIQERKLGEFTFPESTRFVAAGNRQSDRTYANQMPSALRNRFTHITTQPEEDDWVAWANSEGFSPLITGFIRFMPQCLIEIIEHSATSEENKRVKQALSNNAFATPRSWEAVNKFLTLATDANGNLDFAKVQPLILGTIGEETATKFNGYIRLYKNLPDLNHLIKNPKSFMVPTDPGTQYAICSGLAAKTTRKNLGNIIEIINRMGQEFQVMCVKDVASRTPAITMEPLFADWANDNADILF